MSRSKSNFGSASPPCEANGPRSARVTGPSRPCSPRALIRTLASSRPLLTSLLSPKVSSRIACGSSLPLEPPSSPQAASPRAETSSTRRSIGQRDMRPQHRVRPLMSCRTILYTGKGGVGKTSVAAATARRCAAEGARTLVVSTDPAHSLGDVLGEALGADPVSVGPSLWAQQITAQEELERNWAAVQDWAGDMLVERGVDRITAEELTVPPGADELFALLAIKRHHEDEDFDVVVVDCAPTGETLRLLSFPDVARWWLEKVFPQQGRILDDERQCARGELDVTLPGAAVREDVQRLVENLIAMHAVLRDREHVSIRLVMNPDRMVVDEARRTFTYLNLYGFLTDAVVVNRVFPDDVGPYFEGWRATQQEALEIGRASCRERV